MVYSFKPFEETCRSASDADSASFAMWRRTRIEGYISGASFLFFQIPHWNCIADTNDGNTICILILQLLLSVHVLPEK